MPTDSHQEQTKERIPGPDSAPGGGGTPVAVITGGQGVLGQAIARALASEGWLVHAPGHRELDVGSPDNVRGWFARLPACALLVNNAGITRDKVFPRLSEPDWDDVVGTNLGGAARCTRAALPLMLRAGGGTILNISSHSALSGPSGQAAYAAAKAALIGFTRSLAREYGPRNIRANVVLPGFLDSPMTRRLPAGMLEAARRNHTLGRFTTPEESARFIAFLATCPHISGQIFALDSRPADWG